MYYKNITKIPTKWSPFLINPFRYTSFRDTAYLHMKKKILVAVFYYGNIEMSDILEIYNLVDPVYISVLSKEALLDIKSNLLKENYIELRKKILCKLLGK